MQPTSLSVRAEQAAQVITQTKGGLTAAQHTGSSIAGFFVVHLDVVGFQTHCLGLWEVLMVAKAVEGVLQGHLQCCMGTARWE